MKKVSIFLFVLIILSINLNAKTLYGWGSNVNGQLGLGDNWTPKMSLKENDWKTIACGKSHTVGIKNDGTLWAWGNNEECQLGDGTVIDRLSPVQVGGKKKWRFVSSSGCYVMALSDGPESVELPKNDSKYLFITPNPAGDFITVTSGAINPKVNLGDDEYPEIQIYNTLGEKVITVEAIHELPIQINISALPKGIYFVQVGGETEKFVKI